MNDKKIGRRHHWRDHKRHVPSIRRDYPTAIQSVANALQIATDKQFAELLGNRIKPQAIRDLRRGKARVPAWVWDTIAPLIAERRSQLELAANTLEIEQRKTRQNEAG